MPAMQMALLERRELDAGSGEWRQNHRQVLPAYGSESAFLVAMPEEHHLSSFSTVPLEALRDEYFVTMPPVYTDWDFLQRVCQQVGFSPVVIREVNEPQTVLAMVSIGMGLAFDSGQLRTNELARCHFPSAQTAHPCRFIYCL
ncbi:LysR substrate-binding domain-containing protein [Escherichia coli]